MQTATILITVPKKLLDPTQFTYSWGMKAVKMAKDLKYKVVVLERDKVTYENVTNALVNNNVRMVVHFGHGCRTNLQGQDGCIITKGVSFYEEEGYQRAERADRLLRGRANEVSTTVAEERLMNTIHYHDERIMTLKILNGLDDPCERMCTYPNNVWLLNDKIVYTVACYSADQLGVCAVRYGADTYVGSDEVFLFPADHKGSQDMFGDLNLIMYKELLMGHTIREAAEIMDEKEDEFISRYKPIKYIALPALFNKVHRRLLGDLDVTIYSNQECMSCK